MDWTNQKWVTNEIDWMKGSCWRRLAARVKVSRWPEKDAYLSLSLVWPLDKEENASTIVDGDLRRPILKRLSITNHDLKRKRDSA